MAKDDPRSPQQNKAFHVYCTEVSTILNEAGVTPKILLDDFDIDFNMDMVKRIFQRIGEIKFDKPQTRDWTSGELQDAWEEFNRQIAKHGLHLPFPTDTADFDEEFLRAHGIID